MAGSLKRYGCDWEPLMSDATIEATMIRRGGAWTGKDGTQFGMGLKYHFKKFISLLWPEHVWHRWNELELDCFLNYRIIGEIGPASSGKTHSAAVHVLADYYIWSDCTTVLVSSTEREMLEMRVWGEIKKLHRQAKERFPELIPGNLLESRQRIITDSRYAEAEGRDFRNGVCGVPLKKGGNYQGLGCFPAGTIVDTPSGDMPIEQIKVGDEVYNAIGCGRVRETMVRNAPKLIRVHHENGSFDCTPEHLILTQRGWIQGVDLTSEHLLVSTYEAMHILQQTHPKKPTAAQPILLERLQVEGAIQGETLPSLRQGVPETDPWEEEVLFSEVPPSIVGQALYAVRRDFPTDRATRRFLHAVLCSELEKCPARDNEQDESRQGLESHWGKITWALEKESRKTCCTTSQDEGNRSKNTPREDRSPNVSGGNLQRVDGSNKAGSNMARNQARRGNRWGTSSLWEASRIRQIKGFYPPLLRVDRIEILQQGSGPDSENDSGQYRVYNLEVEGHPSYSVTGVLVHNSMVGIKNSRVRMIADELSLCPRIFVDAISNLNKNPDFKCIGLGNPKDTTDALGLLCEPAAHIGGWDGGIDQQPQTKTWETRFSKGICIQLVGSDSPNLDGKLGIPLIDQQAIDADIAFYGRDSLQFTMMNQGCMPRGQGMRRVLTRQKCLKFGAMEEAIWANSNITKIGFLDAAYGAIGGDRCVFGELNFGMDPNGKQILALKDTMLVPIVATSPDPPEDQIATFVKGQCESRNIPPQNFAFDSTGRGSLVGALGRIWSVNVVGVEFGGKPSERLVTWIPTSNPVTCREYYSKFVTELWFSVALIVQASQFRGMTEDVMMEGCMREWGFVGGNKIEVEPKDKMKLKTGRSPDLFDALVAGVERARQLGFVIASIGTQSAGRRNDDAWKNLYRDRMRRLHQNHALTHS